MLGKSVTSTLLARKAVSTPVLSTLSKLSFTQKSTLKTFTVDNPYTGAVHAELPLATLEQSAKIIEELSEAQRHFWKMTRISSGSVHRQQVCVDFLEELKKMKEEIALEITATMGKPLHQARNEVDTCVERAEGMIEISTQIFVGQFRDMPGQLRDVWYEPKGNAFVIAPWNYPLLCAINSIIPAILTGNGVLLKMSSRTPTIGKFFQKAFEKTDVPGILRVIQCDHDVTAEIIRDNPRINHVVFTGSVEGGRQIQSACASPSKFLDSTLELGGKDPAYVHEDANFDEAVFGIVDGAIYNAGQSCCGIERAYVHASLYDRFCERAAEMFDGLVVGDPMDDATTIGPMASRGAGAFLEAQINDAVEKGGKIIAGTGKSCTDAKGQGRFFSPTLVKNCNHTMDLMKEESFGPVLGVMPVVDERQALDLMNDSQYGLSAAVYTKDHTLAVDMARKLETGTVFMNRCDYLDPQLPWSGVKDTGKGQSLSVHGFLGFSKLKSINFKLPAKKPPMRV